MVGNRGMPAMPLQWGFAPFGATTGPFQNGLPILPPNLRPSDQGHMFGGANRQNDRSSGSEDNNGNANAAIMSHSERVARNTRFLESLGHQKSDSYSAMVARNLHL